MFGWFTGILGAVCGWLARNFPGKSILEFVKVRQEIQEELTYLSNVDLPSSQTFCEGTAADYEEEVRIFAEARGKVRRLGSKLSALNTSFYRPMSYLPLILGYKIDNASAGEAHFRGGMVRFKPRGSIPEELSHDGR